MAPSNNITWWELAQLVTALLGVASVITGTYAFFWQWMLRALKEDHGSICGSRLTMGYFTVRRPSFFGYLFWKATKLPVLPTIRGIIEAGDDLLWTSSIIESMHWSHDEVCWVPLYTSVFNEIAWRPKTHTVYERTSPALIPIISQASKHAAEVKASRGYLVTTSPKMWSGVYSPFTLLLAPKRIFRVDLEAMDYENEEEDGRDECSRHLLYSPHSGPSPILLDCIRPLDRYRIPSEADTRTKWIMPQRLRNLCRPWIIDQKPCIEVRREELAALILILGIRLHHTPGDSRLRGDGVFGVHLDGAAQGLHYGIRIARSRRSRLLHGTKGSGYTTSFAKWMGAGAIPWGFAHEYVSMVWMTDEVLKGIKAGKSIKDYWPEHEWSPQLHFLVSLEEVSSIRVDAYMGVTDEVQSGSLVGCFMKGDGVTPVDTKRARWANVVASIAFGGLVPQTSPQVQEAVRFTVGGKTGGQGEDDSLYNWLERLINQVHMNVDRENIFGKYVAWRSCHGKTPEQDILNNPPHPNPGTAASVFGRYMALLEFVAARCLRSGQSVEACREQIFLRAAGLISSCYLDAIKGKGQYYDTVLGSEVSRIGRRLTEGKIEIEDCAVLIRCILAAWAGQVRTLRVFESRDQITEVEKCGSGKCELLFVEDLPTIAALG